MRTSNLASIPDQRPTRRFLSLILSLLSLQIAQQPVKGLLICLWLFPAREIPDMMYPAQIRRPGLLCREYTLIYTDTEQHQALLSRLFLQRCLHLTFHPGALNGLF